MSIVNFKGFRHDPFDIQGALTFVWAENFFFGQNGSKIIFFPPDYYFSLSNMYNIWNNIQAFATTLYKFRIPRQLHAEFMLSQQHHAQLRLSQQIHTQSRFSRQLQTAEGTTRHLHRQLDTLSRFSSQLHTQIDLTSLFYY